MSKIVVDPESGEVIQDGDYRAPGHTDAEIEALASQEYKREYFTPGEAASKVGQRIRSLIAFSGVPKGTEGIVLEPDDDLVSLPIQWGLPKSRQYGTRTKPLVDWFSKDEYEQFLEEV